MKAAKIPDNMRIGKFITDKRKAMGLTSIKVADSLKLSFDKS